MQEILCPIKDRNPVRMRLKLDNFFFYSEPISFLSKHFIVYVSITQMIIVAWETSSLLNYGLVCFPDVKTSGLFIFHTLLTTCCS